MKLVQDRRAGAVLPTEATVWETLATEVGTRFLAQFLAGAPAGEALLRVRRGLLARHTRWA